MKIESVAVRQIRLTRKVREYQIESSFLLLLLWLSILKQNHFWIDILHFLSGHNMTSRRTNVGRDLYVVLVFHSEASNLRFCLATIEYNRCSPFNVLCTE